MDWLDDREFYEAMYAYRCAPLVSQVEVIERFEAVKQLIRDHDAAVNAWQERGQQLIERNGFDAMFALGAWWADRPWRVAKG